MTPEEIKNEILWQLQNIPTWHCEFATSWYHFSKKISTVRLVQDKDDPNEWFDGVSKRTDSTSQMPDFFEYRMWVDGNKIWLKFDMFEYSYKRQETGDLIFEHPYWGEIAFRKAPEKEL